MEEIKKLRKIKIKVEASSKDPYSRYHAVTVDEDLPPNFWKTGVPKTVRAGHFLWEKELELPKGRHYVIYGNSASCSEKYYWTAAIYINDEKIADSNTVCRGNYLEAYFTVPQLTVINKIISKISKVSVFGIFKTIAGGKLIKVFRKANKKK